MTRSYSLAEIAKWVGGVVRGDASVRIHGLAGVEEAESGQLTWVQDDRYADLLRASRAGAVLVHEQFGETAMPAVLCARPEVALCTVLEKFAPPTAKPAAGVHPTACVASSARLGRDVAVGPYAVIGEDVEIGDRSVVHAHCFVGEKSRLGADCTLWPGVVLRERCTLGDRVIVHPNSTIGADGFGYVFANNAHLKIPHIGTVEIESDVEIGANCAVDRAKFGVTRIGAGTKIDNLVQVAHNVQIGPNCILVALSGIGGSARLGQGVVLGGKVGIRDHITLHDGVQVAACACVSKDLPAGGRYFGIPAVEYEDWVRERAKVRRLPQMSDAIKDLIQRVTRLEEAADD